MKKYVDRAIVLSRINYGERDRVITVLGKNHGKIALFAKAVRSEKSRLAGGVELLSVSELTFIDGKSNLKTLSGSRLLVHYEKIMTDYDRMQLAFEILKTISKLAEDGTGQEYYPVLETFLSSLNNLDVDHNIAELWCNLRLLSLGGTLPQMEVLNAENAVEKLFNFDQDDQQFSYHPDGQFSVNDLKLIKLLVRSSAPIKLSKPIGTEQSLARFSRLLLKTNLSEV